MLKDIGLAALTKMLPLIMGNLTPMIREALKDLLRSLYAKALATENAWDDAAVELVAGILDVDLGGVVPAPVEAAS